MAEHRPGKRQDTGEAAQASWKHITAGDTQSKNQTAWAQVPLLLLSVTSTKFFNFIFLYKMVISTSSISDVVMRIK